MSGFAWLRATYSGIQTQSIQYRTNTEQTPNPKELTLSVNANVLNVKL